MTTVAVLGPGVMGGSDRVGAGIVEETKFHENPGLFVLFITSSAHWFI
jgi:hypothetical protein